MSPPVTIVVDPKVLTAGIQEPTGPVQILKLPNEDTLSNLRQHQPATVGNPNADLEAAYEMGFRAALQVDEYISDVDMHVESHDYADQRRSDLKELVSYDRSI